MRIRRTVAVITVAGAASLAFAACGGAEQPADAPDVQSGADRAQAEADRAEAERDKAEAEAEAEKAEAEKAKAQAEAEKAKAEAERAKADRARAEADAEVGAARPPSTARRGQTVDYNAALSPTAEMQGGPCDWWTLDVSGDGVTDTVRVRWEGVSGYQLAGYDVDQDGDLDEFLDLSDPGTPRYGYDLDGDEMPDRWKAVSGTGNGIPDELES